MTVYQIVENLSAHDARGQLISYQHPANDRLFSTYEKAKQNIPEKTLNIDGPQYEIKGIIVE